MKFNDQFYFPVLFEYKKNTFDPNENSTEVDYKVLQKSEVFTKNKNNYMVFPIIPYGQQENIPLSHISLTRDITVKIELEPKVGSMDINEDLTIKKMEGSEFFFNPDQSFKKAPLSDFMTIIPELKSAIENRFANKPCEEFSADAVLNQKKVHIKLIPFTPDENKPNKIRMQLTNLDQAVANSDFTQNTIYLETGVPKNEEPKIFKAFNDEQKEEFKQKILKRAINFVDPLFVVINGETWRISFERKESFYPYPPTKSNPMGFDESGRDVLTQVIYGYRLALSFGFLLVAFSLGLGIMAGAIQGYFGGKTDLMGQRLIEIWSALPFLYIMILLGTVFGRSFMLLLFVFSIFNWIGISYYVRADFLKLRKTSYVEAAKCLGISNVKIMWRHILPNALVPIITFFPFKLVGAIGALTMLDFLGYGLPPGTPSWGDLLSQGDKHHSAWWLILFPSLALFIVMLLGTLIGDGLRAAFDPRKFHKIE